MNSTAYHYTRVIACAGCQSDSQRLQASHRPQQGVWQIIVQCQECGLKVTHEATEFFRGASEAFSLWNQLPGQIVPSTTTTAHPPP